MGRKPRIEYEGAIYHLIQRGNNREYIFRRREDKKFFLNTIDELLEEFPFQLLGYVIMDNHYHLLVKLGKSGLYRIMQRINNKYSRYFNRINLRTGHVFEGRYKSIWVKDDKHLLSLLRYIHQNPVRAKMCEHVYEYGYSSDIYYRNNIGGSVNIELLLNMFSQDRNAALEQYRLFMDENETIENARLFFEDCEIIEDKNDPNHYENLHQKPGLDELLLATGMDEHELIQIKDGCRKRHLTDYKKRYIKDAYDYGYSIKDISSNINISCEAAYRMISRKR